MSKKIILTLALSLMLTLLLVLSVSASEPIESWDVSSSSSDSVTVYLYEDTQNEGYYTVTVSGTGKMKDWAKNSRAPWNSSYIKRITSITVEEGVTAVGSYAFYECSSLTGVVIPRSVTSIGYVAFSKCTTLKGIAVDENNANYCDIDGNLYTKDKTTLVQYAIGKEDTSFVIPDTVITVGKCALEYCTNLKTVAIHDSVTSIGDWTFNSCSSLTIYAEVANKPNGWTSNWNSSRRPVVWGHSHAYENYECVCGKFDVDGCANNIFTFKGYSFGSNGSMAVGYGIDYEALSLYEEKTGKELKIGVAFASLELLGGQNPIDNQGNAITLDVGRIANRDLTELDFTSYDFVINGITEDLTDYSLVIAAYINDGSVTKYVQQNGLSDNVSGITYNEAKESVTQ